jgi:hypothetical protein
MFEDNVILIRIMLFLFFGIIIIGGEEVVELVRDKIFSSQHLLALMFTGEMCYWLHTHFPSQSRSPSCTPLNSSSILNEAAFSSAPTADHFLGYDWKREAIRRLQKYKQVFSEDISHFSSCK